MKDGAADAIRREWDGYEGPDSLRGRELASASQPRLHKDLF